MRIASRLRYFPINPRPAAGSGVLIGLLITAAPARAFVPMRYGPQNLSEWIILLCVLVPVGILAHRAENARAEKRRRLLQQRFPEEEIPMREFRRDLRLRMLALVAIVTGSPLLFWLFFA